MSDSFRLDSIDLKILRSLQEDARISNKDLATAIGIAPSTCLDRVQRLRSIGVIAGYTLRVDPERMGRSLQAFIAVKFTVHRSGLVEPFVRHLLDQPEVRTVYHVSGQEDFLMLIAAESAKHLQRLILDKVAVRSEVTQVHTMLIFQEWDGGPLLPPRAQPSPNRS